MMHSTHPDEEQVQRFLHKESTPHPGELLRHIEICDECRERVAGAQREEDAVLALLAQADRVPPSIELAAVVARARRRRAMWTRWAASGLLAVGLAGAADAAAGFPVLSWVSALTARWSRAPGPEVAPLAPVAAEPAVGGVAVVPGSSFVVLFRSAQSAGEVRVTVTEGSDLVVRAPSGAATFTSDPDRVVIDNRGSTADFDIAIPRGTTRVEIRIGDRRVFLKDGARIITVAPDSGRYRIALTRPLP